MKKVIAVDTETTGLHFWKDFIFGLSVSYNDVDQYWDIRRTDQSILKRKLKDSMDKADVVVFHHAKFDIHFLREWGVDVPVHKAEDTMIRAALIDEHRLRYDLDSLGKDIIGMGKIGDIYEDLAAMFGGKATRSAQMKNLHRAPPELVAPYAKRDTRVTLELWKAQEIEIEKQDLHQVHQLEKEVLPVLVDMEKRGVKVDIDGAEKAIKICTSDIILSQKQLDEMAGFKINPNPSGSIHKLFKPKQDANGIWTLIDGTVAPSTGAGKASINADVLRDMKHPAASLILEIRKMHKMRDTFLKGHILGHHDNGIIHANFNQTKGDNDAGTGTGRLSVNDPALQQIPKRDKKIASVVRSIFLPDNKQEWYCVDGETEYLTRTGWKKIKDYKDGDEIANALPNIGNPNGAMVIYEKPKKFIVKKPTGNWYDIKEMSVSGDHGIPSYRRRNKDKFEFNVLVSDSIIKLSPSRRFVIPQVWTEERIGVDLTDNQIRIMVAVMADATFSGKNSKIGYCKMALKKERKKERIKFLLGLCGIDYLVWKSKSRKGYTTIQFKPPMIDKYYSNGEWWDASIEQRRLILEECLLWDGSKFISDNIKYKRFYSSNKNSIDFIQWCAHSTGQRAEITESRPGQYSLALSMKQSKGFAVKDITKVESPKLMYCFETTTKFWIARRNNCVFITANCMDWQAMDFRIFAHYLDDPKITKIFKDNPEADFHQITADMTGLPRAPRYAGEASAKMINLANVFGMGSGTLADKMNLPYTIESFETRERGKIKKITYKKPGPEAMEVFNKYHSAIPGVKSLLDRAASVAKSRGYVKTVMGRRLRFPGGQYSHKAGGLIFQGSAADALKVKMVEIHKMLKGTEGRLLLNVHDEFDCSLPKDLNLDNKIQEIMHDFGPESTIHFKIPIRSSCGKGENWWKAC